MDLSWLDEKGISTEDGLGYTGGTEQYIAALQRYYKGYETNRKVVEEMLATYNVEGYCIKVHALKSNSRMIGALALARAFEMLEMASRKEDIAAMQAGTAPVLALYEEVIDILRPIGEVEAAATSGELSAAEASDTAGQLLEALDDFDDEQAAKLAEKLAGYPFRLAQKQMLREAMEHIQNFMYDEAAELIREISSAIA